MPFMDSSQESVWHPINAKSVVVIVSMNLSEKPIQEHAPSQSHCLQ